MKFKIPSFDTTKTFNEMCTYIKKILNPQMEKWGYYEDVFDDYLGIEGYYIDYKHPQRVSKLFVVIHSTFGDHEEIDGALEIYEVSVNISFSTMNMNDTQELMIDDNSTNLSITLYLESFNNNEIDINKRDINLSSTTLSEFNRKIQQYESTVYETYLKNAKGAGFIEVLGGIDIKNSTFKTMNDVKEYLEWLGVDTEKIAVDNEVDELLPQAARDVFLF